MIRPFFLALGCCLILTSCGGRDEIQEELDRIKADGSPITLEDLGLPPGGYESPRWKTVLDISEKLAKERKERGFDDYHVTAMKPVGPGVARVVTRLETPVTRQDKEPITWDQWNQMLAKTRVLMDGLPSPEPGPLLIPDYSQGMNTKVPQIGAALDIIKTSSWMILGSLQEGKVDQALGELSDARQWGINLSGHTTLIEGLIRVTCDGVLLGNSWEILQQPTINEAQLTRLAGIWEKCFDPSEVLLIWRGERVCGWKTISRFRTLKDIKDASRISNDSPSGTEIPSFGNWVADRVYIKFRFNHDLAY